LISEAILHFHSLPLSVGLLDDYYKGQHLDSLALSFISASVLLSRVDFFLS